MSKSVEVKIDILDKPRRADLTVALGPEQRLEVPTEIIRANFDDLLGQSNLAQEEAWTTNPSKNQWNKFKEGWEQWCQVAQPELAAKLSQSIRIPIKLPIVSRPIGSLFPTIKADRALPSHGIQWLLNRIAELNSLVKSLINISTDKHSQSEKAQLKSRAAITKRNLMVLLCPRRVTKLVEDIDGLGLSGEKTTPRTMSITRRYADSQAESSSS